MRVWHWLCSVEFPELIWRRWRGSVPERDELPQVLTGTIAGHFLGASSLNGVSRNTLARLWWTAEALQEEGNYDLARRMLANQDMFQNICERFFGIRPTVAKACLRRLEGEAPADVRRAAKWLQQRAATTVIEHLSEAEITAILNEALSPVA